MTPAAGARMPAFPLGAAVTLEQLDFDPHPALARLREHEPVSWLPCLDGWLITRHDLALAAMRDAGAFTVDDPRFSTAQVIGASMLSLDGDEHARHRAPFVAPFRAAEVRQRFAELAQVQAERLIDELASHGSGELRRGFAGPMSATIVTRALGLREDEVRDVLAWYDAIVDSVTKITAGRGRTDAGDAAFARLRERLAPVIADGERASLLGSMAAGPSGLTHEQIVANAAVLLFGGIETTEGMIANAVLMLLERPPALAAARADGAALDAAIEESLRLEPAAAVIDRYATADVTLAGAPIRRGELVRISITAANRDPAVFPAPDEFDLARMRRGHLAFAQGPHVCVGVHLARLEARTALATLLHRLPAVRLDPARPPQIRGLVFRKPPRLDALWS